MTETKSVRYLYMHCSLPLLPSAMAASDTCQAPAVCAVKEGNSYWYRCQQHHNIISLFGIGKGAIKHIIRGESVTEVPVTTRKVI